MWFKRQDKVRKFIVYFFASYAFGRCEAITNAEFNEQIRGYSVVENNNLSDVKTLQKQEPGLSRYANPAPVQNPIIFKDDSLVSGSSHARGLLHHGHTGYGYDYEDAIGHHGYNYPGHDNHHHGDDYHHYEYHDSHHQPHHGYGHGHHKYYDHGLAHKALLWPIAGIALLGAAAALVTNPVLLQLGVVSGKRRRRQVDDIENTAKASIQKWSKFNSNYDEDTSNSYHKVIKKRMLRKNDYKVGKRVLHYGDVLQLKTDNALKKYSEENRRLVPIPLLIRRP